MATNFFEKDGTDLDPSNWEVLLLSTLMRCRQHLPSPDTSGDNSKEQLLAADVDEVLELAWQRGHGWIPRPE